MTFFQPLKTNERYDLKDIEWLMSVVDVESLLDRLNVRIVSKHGDWWWGFCPDHSLFTGKEPSHPKWSVNVITGVTKCFTENRASNLFWVVKRLKNLTIQETIEWMTNGQTDSSVCRFMSLTKSLTNMFTSVETDTCDLTSFEEQLANAELGRRALSYLAKWNIRLSTAKDFSCVEFDSGYYSGRLIFPVKNEKNDVVGFVATDMLGEDEWLKNHPLVYDKEIGGLRSSQINDYKKVLFPKNFNAGKCLMGFDKARKNDVLFLVEGCRDVMKLSQEGFLTLGLGGTNISDEQTLMIASLVPKKIVVMFDGDANGAGQREQRKVAMKLNRFFDNVFFTELPIGKDPKNLSCEEILFLLENETFVVSANQC